MEAGPPQRPRRGEGRSEAFFILDRKRGSGYIQNIRSMNKLNRYGLAVEALSELKSELLVVDDAVADSESPLETTLAELAPLPEDALFLGRADDGLPVLLNLLDPAPGPLLIQGDAGSGKTGFLRSAAAAIEICHPARRVQYGVVTPRPEEWEGLPPGPHQIGIFSVRERTCLDFVLSLNAWAHSNRSDQSVVLFWDGLELVDHLEAELVDNFRWLLLRGPVRKVWPIVTLDTSKKHGLDEWRGAFRTSINGRVADRQNGLLEIEVSSRPHSFGAGRFILREGNTQLGLWMPKSGIGVSATPRLLLIG